MHVSWSNLKSSLHISKQQHGRQCDYTTTKSYTKFSCAKSKSDILYSFNLHSLHIHDCCFPLVNINRKQDTIQFNLIYLACMCCTMLQQWPTRVIVIPVSERENFACAQTLSWLTLHITSSPQWRIFELCWWLTNRVTNDEHQKSGCVGLWWRNISRKLSN